ncbi:MAG: hypothetical protein ACI310_02390 [Bacilli bacterium]
MSKKRMIIVTSIILSVVVISFGIIKLYQSYALANDIVDTNSSPTININVTENNAINVPANGHSNVFYMVNNTSPGTVNYGIGYSGTDVTAKVFSTSNDPASGLIEENGRKYVKLRLENSSSTSQSVVLSTILGYSGDNDLTSITPSGVTLVTEVYTPPPTLVNTITNLYTSASKTTVINNSITYNYANIYDTDDDSSTSGGLMNDRLGGTTTDYDAGNIRYYGANPNNYIYFNCSDYSNQTSDTCELWRIIGVFNGKVKIMRGSTIGSYSWDNKDTSTGAESAYGKNDWTDARLMKLLNPTNYYTIDSNDNGLGQSLYYNSGSGSCYSGQNNATVSCDFTSTGIKNDTTRNMIEEIEWNLGEGGNSGVYSDQIYEYERGTTVYSGRPTTWIGKIALPYPSDYGYAADLGRCTQTLDNYSDSTCTSVNWMKNIITNNGNSNGWLLTPSSSDSYSVWIVVSSGYSSVDMYGSYYDTSYTYGVSPVLYLSSELGIESGTGTSTDPYRLSV